MTPAPALLATTWVLVVAAACLYRPPVPPRLRALLVPPRPRRARPRHRLHTWTGLAVLRLWPRRLPSPGRERWAARLGAAVLAALPALVLRPALTPFAAALASLYPHVEDRRAAASHRSRVERQLPDVVDLLVLAVGTGLNVPLALGAVATRAPPGPVTAALRRTLDATAGGARLADALDDAGRALGDAARPVIGALVTAERYGLPLGPTLDRIAAEARATRRRRAEEAARRVPVKLLFPLVTCSLPAFALLTVAPLFASGVASLRLPT